MADLRVVELGRGIAAAYCTKLLADLGAKVTLIEAPAGHPLRHQEPLPAKWRRERGGGLFQYLASGKNSVVVDLAHSNARDELRALTNDAALLVEDLGPNALESFGIRRDVLDAGSVPTSLVRIAPFGHRGPYRDRAASSLVVQAAGGWVARIGTVDSRPYYVGCQIEEYVAATYGAAAAITAVVRARQTREAVNVDVSIFDCIVGTIPYPMLQKITFDRLGFPVPQRYQPIPGIFHAADGYVGISALTGQHWADVCALLEVPHLATKMREVTLRGAEWLEFARRAEPWLRARSTAEIVELFQALRVPAVPIGNGANLPTMEPFRCRGFYVTQPAGGFPRPLSPVKLSRTPALVPRPAPLLGERQSGLSRERRAPIVRANLARRARTSRWRGGRSGLPLSGLRVLDMTTFWAGPYFTMYLASFGADVIKVESPKRPDGFRFVAAFPQLGAKWWEQSGVFHATNLGKRGLTLDLDQPRGKELALRLAEEADVVAENFSPRVIEHFGLGYEAVRAVNPSAIMVRMPGFGLTGPCRDWVGWALTFEQMAGCAEITGEEDGRRFAPGGIADPVVGMQAALALQAALAHRERTGEGQLIEIAQVETVAAMTAEQVIRHALTGEVFSRKGNRAPHAAPQGVYRGGGNDEWIALTVRDDGDWRRLAVTIGREDIFDDRRFADEPGRRRHHDEIDRVIEEWTSARPAADAERVLVGAGIPAARLLKTEGFYSDPQLIESGYFRSLEHTVCGRLDYPRWPLRFSFGPEEPYGSPAPTLGQHNDEILGGMLGLSKMEIDGLRTAGIIGDTLPDA